MLQHMTCLQELKMRLVPSTDPSLLSSLARLTSLVSTESVLTCPVAATVDAILTALLQLKQLKFLQLPGCFWEDLPSSELYANLTVSKQLAALVLCRCYIPQEAIGFMFPSPGNSRDLALIRMSSDLLGGKGNCQRLVTCCPSLQKLSIEDSIFFPNRAGLIDGQVIFLTLSYHAQCCSVSVTGSW